MIVQKMAVLAFSGTLLPTQSGGGGSISQDPWSYISQLGVFAVVVIVAWWLLGRSDRQIDAERAENAKEVSRLTTLLEAEQKAHDVTRQKLYDAIREHE